MDVYSLTSSLRQESVASSRMEIDQARLLTQDAAWEMDSVGKQDACQERSMVKVVVPNMIMQVLDRVSILCSLKHQFYILLVVIL